MLKFEVIGSLLQTKQHDCKTRVCAWIGPHGRNASAKWESSVPCTVHTLLSRYFKTLHIVINLVWREFTIAECKFVRLLRGVAVMSQGRALIGSDWKHSG